MHIANGVGITDEKNRYNHIVPLSTIIKMYEQKWDYHTVMTIGHDRTKTIGYSDLNGIYMEPGKAYLLTKSHIADNAEDHELVNTIADHNDYQYFYVENKDEVNSLRDKLKDYLSESHKVATNREAVAILDKGIVERVFPKLKEYITDGLLDLRMIQPVYKHESEDGKNRILVPGVYRYGGFLLFAHPYFRRSFSLSNSMNAGFLEAFECLRDDTSLKLRIAIDMDMIGLIGSESSEIEYQYWWGPHFSDSLTEIPHGVTVHKNEKYDNLFSNIVSTQFFWYEQDGRSSFECEEVTDRENEIINGESYYGCRYVHSMVDMNTQKPCHLDGAVRLYNEKQIIDRLDDNNDISKAGKHTIYRKIWRIDNEFDVHIWKELITQYLRDNHLIGEYFGGEDNVITQMEAEKIEEKPSKADKYIPANLSDGNGIRILLKYGKAFSLKGNYNAELDNTSMIQKENGEQHKILDSEIVTLIKLLRKKGLQIRMPFTEQIDFGDTISNLQIIACNNIETVDLVLESVFELCKAWKELGDNRLVSFGIHINCNTEESVTISLAGHINDMVSVLEKVLPFSSTSVEEWIQKVYKINNSFPHANNCPNKSLLISNDRLYFKRIFVKPEYCASPNYKDEEVPLRLQLSKAERNAVRALKITIAPVFLFKNSRCEKCQKNYRNCECIKFIDASVSFEKQDAEKVGYVWAKHSKFPTEYVL